MSNVAPSADAPRNEDLGVGTPETISTSVGNGSGDGGKPSGPGGRPKRGRRLGHRLRTGIVLVVMVGAGVFASIIAYQHKAAVHRGHLSYDAQSSGVKFNQNNEPTVPFVDIYAYVVSVAPDTQTARVRLVFGYWQENSSTDSPYSPQQLTVSVLGTVTDPSENSSPTANSYTFDADKQMRAIDVEMNLGDSTALKYPFDGYAGFLAFNVSDSHGNIVQSAVSLNNSADGWKTSPDSHLCTVINSSWYPYFTFGPATPDCSPGGAGNTPTTGLQGLHIGIHRESASRIYALFIMTLMWTLALSGVVTVLTVVRNKDEYDFLMPTYLAALLFAFPLIRGLLPGNPALGVLADFAAYFWVEGVVGVALLVLVICWIKRSRHHLEGSSEGRRAKIEE